MRRVLGVVMVVSVMAGHAYAQSNSSGTLAEQLFNQARELAKANRWAEACPKFEASLRADPALGTRLNLASCYEHIGKLASAWGLYRETIDLAKRVGDLKKRDYAQKQAAALEPRLAKLSISAPARPPAGFVVTRDGVQIDASALGIPLYVDAGPHEIKASAPGFEAFTQAVALVDGKTETLAIPDLKAVPPAPVHDSGPPAAAHVPATEPVAAPSPVQKNVATTEPVVAPSSVRKYVGLGVGGAGVVAAGVGLLFGAKASSSYSDAKALCGSSLACANTADYGRGKQLISDARSNATLSTVLVAAGGAAIVTGAIVFLTAPRARERGTARIVPVTHDRGTGLAVIGGF